MEIIANAGALFLGCIVLLSLSIWFYTNSDKESREALFQEVLKLQRKQSESQELIASCVNTVANLSTKLHNLERDLNSINSENEHFEEYIERTAKDIIRLDRELSRIRPQIVLKHPIPVRISKDTPTAIKKVKRTLTKE